MLELLGSLVETEGVTTDREFEVLANMLEKHGQVVAESEWEFSGMEEMLDENAVLMDLVCVTYKLNDREGQARYYELIHQVKTPNSPEGAECVFLFEERKNYKE